MTPEPPDAIARAQAAARDRLINTLLREVGPRPTGAGELRLPVPGTDRALVVTLAACSPSGHHRLDPAVSVAGDAGARPATHDEVVADLLAIVDAAVGDRHGPSHPQRRTALAAQVADSVAHTARFLAAPDRPEPAACADPRSRTRHAEQSLRRGHPFHPTPKSRTTGRGPAPDFDRWAPELGASFRLHHLAVHPDLVVGERVTPGPWIPEDEPGHRDWPVLPVHPFQAAHLRERADLAVHRRDGRLVDLGAGGPEVYPTSSVRTVCAPGFPTAWKLPLHLRLTNFVRTVPTEHARRAADASRVVAALRGHWEHPGFEVVVESGWRGLDPAAVGEDAAADLTVVFRENPFATDPAAPRVLAGLIEPGRDDGDPPLVTAVREAGGDAGAWLRAYLRISLAPMLAVFGADGVGFEAHLQNSLVHTEGGWPTRFWVRDMEGTHVSRDRLPAGLDPASPLVYDDDEAWRRLRYHAVVNGLGGVVAVLGHHLAPEAALWRVVADELAALAAAGGPGAPYARDLLTAPALPAKANLLSRFAQRGEDPLYVDLPNPIREAHA